MKVEFSPNIFFLHNLAISFIVILSVDPVSDFAWDLEQMWRWTFKQWCFSSEVGYMLKKHSNISLSSHKTSNFQSHKEYAFHLRPNLHYQAAHST